MNANCITLQTQQRTSPNPRTFLVRAACALMLIAIGTGLLHAYQVREPHGYGAAETLDQSEGVADNASRHSVTRSDSPAGRGRDPDTSRRARANPQEDLTPSEKLQRRITSRYGDSSLVGLIRSLSTDRAVSLYRETMDLIDSRHLKPTTYAARTHEGIENLLHAVGNRAFLEANGLSPSREQVADFRHELASLAERVPVRTATEARNLMYAAMDLAYRKLTLRPASVVTEFVYGAAQSLDKYSTFVPLAGSGAPSVSLEDHIVGIGVEIRQHEAGAIVLRTLRDGPADEAGLQRGDVIVSVNGRSLAGRSLDYAVEQIAGPAGTPVLITIEREGRRQPPLSLVRRRVDVHSVSDVRMFDPEKGLGYIKLDRFADSTSEELDRALWDLYRREMKGLVLDLRGNPGGLLTTAIEVSDKFLPAGTIVSTRGRNSADNSSESATFERTWKIPLVVLIDEYSASASEIFAAAIQENARGLIVGRPSYGKGTVQTHFPLQSVSGNLKLTTAKFFSPAGREMAGSGVTPDLHVELPAGERQIVPLAEDRDVQAALGAAGTVRVQELASSQLRAGRAAPDLQLGS